MIRAVIYARVSSEGQAGDAHYSLPTQVEACHQYAAQHDLEVVATFQDDFTGTAPIETRPEGSKAYAMLQSGEADALIAYRFDRIVRPPEEGGEWDIPPMIRSLAKLGKEIHTCNRGRIGTTFADLLLAMLDSKVAGDERRAIIERTMRGRTAKAKDGKVPGTHPPLYGYSYNNGAYQIAEAQARIVRQVFNWYTSPNGSRRSMAEITTELNDHEVPPPNAGKSKVGSRMWYLSAIHHILHNPAYTGWWSWNKIPVEIPPIITTEQFDTAQEIARANLTYSKRNSAHEYLLRGMIYCGCGCRGKFTGARLGPAFVYRPAYRNKRAARLARRACSERIIPTESVEAAAWHYAVTVITSGDLDDMLLNLADQSSRDRQDRMRRIGEIGAELAELESEAEQLVKVLFGGIIKKKADERAAAINRRHAKLTAERDKLVAIRDVMSLDAIAAMARLRVTLAMEIPNASPQKRRSIFEMMRLRVDVTDGLGVISSIFPYKSPPIDLHKPYVF